MRLPEPPLLVITDRHQARLPLEAVAAAVLAAGARWLLLREKDLPPPERLAVLRRLAALAGPYNATLAVSADLAAAEAAGVGLHLPSGGDPAAARRRLGAAALIGCSVHGRAAAQRTAAAGADYVTLSPVFASASKPGYGPALGLAGLRAAARGLTVPVVALGGIGPAEVRDCLAAGASAVAVMGGIMRAEDPGAATRAYLAGLA